MAEPFSERDVQTAQRKGGVAYATPPFSADVVASAARGRSPGLVDIAGVDELAQVELVDAFNGSDQCRLGRLELVLGGSGVRGQDLVRVVLPGVPERVLVTDAEVLLEQLHAVLLIRLLLGERLLEG